MKGEYVMQQYVNTRCNNNISWFHHYFITQTFRFPGFSIEGGTQRLIAAYFGIYSRFLCLGRFSLLCFDTFGFAEEPPTLSVITSYLKIYREPCKESDFHDRIKQTKTGFHACSGTKCNTELNGMQTMSGRGVFWIEERQMHGRRKPSGSLWLFN